MLRLHASGHFLVEINLISNRVLEWTPITPAIRFRNTGAPEYPCVSTPTTAAWGTPNLTDEDNTAVIHFGLTWPDIVQLGRDSLRHAFVEEPEKARLLPAYEADLAGFVARFDRKDWRAPLAAARPIAHGDAQRMWGARFPEE